MLSSYNRRTVATPSFKMLVAHLKKSSDPSKGEAGNPQPVRQAFETQVVTTNLGTGILGNINAASNQIRIKVETTDFGNQNLGNAPPFYDQDLIQIQTSGYIDVDRITALKAGTHFGRGEGEGAGNVNDVASDLALVLNDTVSDITAIVDPQNLNHVLVRSNEVTSALFVKVYSFSYLLLNGTPPFLIEDNDGNTIYDPTAKEGGAGVLLIRPNGILPMNES
jgi:hypothetical protein